MLKPNLKAVGLGATLYVPAINSALVELGNLQKYDNLRSLVYCTEDAVSERDLPKALDNLTRTLTSLKKVPLMRFIRPRNPRVLKIILGFKGLENIDGFVLPKADAQTLPTYFEILENHPRFLVMPTVETAVAFDLLPLYSLRDFLVASPLKDRVLAIRIGALDLSSLLGLRREPGDTVYDGPLGHVIDQLVTVFRPVGFALTAPGCEFLNDHDLLHRELAQDAARGLLGKTALHPDQVAVIHGAYMVSANDLAMAKAINDPARPAVFRLNDRMCEKAVHTNWALTTERRAEIYGIK